MGTRSSEIANRFEQTLTTFAEAVKAYPDDKWGAAVTEEGWTVGVCAQHVSGQFPLEMEYISAAAEGKDAPPYSWDDVNGKNDGRAAANANATKAQVLEELETLGRPVVNYLRALDDEQLDRTIKLGLAGGADVSAQQLIEGGILIDHLNAHLKSIQAAS